MIAFFAVLNLKRAALETTIFRRRMSAERNGPVSVGGHRPAGRDDGVERAGGGRGRVTPFISCRMYRCSAAFERCSGHGRRRSSAASVRWAGSGYGLYQPLWTTDLAAIGGRFHAVQSGAGPGSALVGFLRAGCAANERDDANSLLRFASKRRAAGDDAVRGTSRQSGPCMDWKVGHSLDQLARVFVFP